MKKGGGLSDANEKVCRPEHISNLHSRSYVKLQHSLYSRSIASR